mgnify:CR=1 FL=1
MKLGSAAAESAAVLSFGPMKTEKASLREVFEAEEGPLLRFACGMLGRREVAEDIVQDAFLKLHAHWDEVATPRAWLFRTVRNLALNHLRDHKREVSKDETPEWSVEAAPGEELARMEAAGAVRMLIAEMPDDDRTLLLLKYDEELKYGYTLHHLLKGLATSLRRMGVEGPEG